MFGCSQRNSRRRIFSVLLVDRISRRGQVAISVFSPDLKDTRIPSLEYLAGFFNGHGTGRPGIPFER